MHEELGFGPEPAQHLARNIERVFEFCLILLLLMAEAPQPLCDKDAAQRDLVGVVMKRLGRRVLALLDQEAGARPSLELFRRRHQRRRQVIMMLRARGHVPENNRVWQKGKRKEELLPNGLRRQRGSGRQQKSEFLGAATAMCASIFVQLRPDTLARTTRYPRRPRVTGAFFAPDQGRYAVLLPYVVALPALTGTKTLKTLALPTGLETPVFAVRGLCL